MKAFKVEGIVIKRRNVGEADRIITVFSKTAGKLQIKAKGVRKIASRRSGHIELLNHGFFNLHQGRSMPLLTEVESTENFPLLKKDLKRIGSAFHICELVDGLCAENEENKEVFELLKSTLQKLSDAPKLSDVIYEFEIEILKLLGFYRHSPNVAVNTKVLIEEILERKLKTRPILYQFS
ncbi:MAG: DNA repair protein RecO [Candidatus Levybacteria bacterium]|nr:DNA repair protein RecO [Candidatus Levybacteria bacterium]